MTIEERRKIYAALSAPFPEEAVERTDGRVTGRGYDTAGIGYQFVCNRINETLGVGGFRVERKVTVKEVTTAKGRPAFEATCELKLLLGEWHSGTFLPFAEAIGDGGHVAVALADAIKGAFTNGFKKTAAFLGVGRQAYEGTLDDDHVPAEPVGVQRFDDRSPPAAPNAPQQRPALRVAAAPTEGANRPAPASTAAAPSPVRSRLTSKQLSALWAIARNLNYDQSSFRAMVRENFGAQPEFLTKEQASQLIDMLARPAPANGNGAGHDRARQPGEDG